MHAKIETVVNFTNFLSAVFVPIFIKKNYKVEL
jgi:hypothetical protein